MERIISREKKLWANKESALQLSINIWIHLAPPWFPSTFPRRRPHVRFQSVNDNYHSVSCPFGLSHIGPWVFGLSNYNWDGVGWDFRFFLSQWISSRFIILFEILRFTLPIARSDPWAIQWISLMGARQAEQQKPMENFSREWIHKAGNKSIQAHVPVTVGDAPIWRKGLFLRFLDRANEPAGE